MPVTVCPGPGPGRGPAPGPCRLCRPASGGAARHSRGGCPSVCVTPRGVRAVSARGPRDTDSGQPRVSGQREHGTARDTCDCEVTGVFLCMYPAAAGRWARFLATWVPPCTAVCVKQERNMNESNSKCTQAMVFISCHMCHDNMPPCSEALSYTRHASPSAHSCSFCARTGANTHAHQHHPLCPTHYDNSVSAD